MSAVKTFLSSHFPSFYRKIKHAWHATHSFFTGIPEHQRLFERMYEINYWGDAETRSGLGSNLVNTSVIRRELPVIVSGLKAKSILDIPCGDFYWMKLVDLQGTMYIGADIVRPMIEQNAGSFASLNRKFIVRDLLNDPLPPVDIILCRDCLPHLSFADIQKALNNIRQSGSLYLMTSTYTARNENADIETGRFRPLNFRHPPFNFPPPLKLFNEECSYNNNIYSDKSIAVWRIGELPKKKFY